MHIVPSRVGGIQRERVREDNKHDLAEQHFAAAVTEHGVLGSDMYENIRVRLVT